MYLKRLGLEQFRCYQRADILLGPGLHVLAGPNASGKTSVLEAIYLLASTKSHRTNSDRDLVKFGAEWGRVTGEFHTTQRGELTVRVTLRAMNGDSGPRKTIEVNSVPRRRFADIIGQTAVVIFGPDDLNLIKGPPGGRRHYLNAGISQVRPAYLDDLMRYRRALRQRNECLKAHFNDPDMAEVLCAWDVQLVDCAANVSAGREDFIRALAPHLKAIHRDLSGQTEDIEIRYDSDLSEAVGINEKRALMRELLEGALDRDLRLGRTSRGPHRDDIDLTIDGKSVRTFGSQGQQRTAALALSLAEARVIEQWSGETPIVLLDDCLSELDETRARRALELTRSVEQVIVTTASWDRLLDEYAQSARVHTVGGGQIGEGGAE
ncbi:MAG: DNA replication/repair protein RecF [Armatimonadetes bacterium]|nr:DNA replication/repair protein RecF [Armatimonadota bacterium]